MSLVTAFKSAIKGKYVEDKVYEQRLSICRSCNSLRGGTCIECGCFMKIKAWFPDERCADTNPKWLEEKPAEK